MSETLTPPEDANKPFIERVSEVNDNQIGREYETHIEPTKEILGSPPTLSPTVKRPQKIKSVSLSQTILGTDAGVRALLGEMRSRSGVGFRMLANRMGVTTEDVKQYFNGKRGSRKTTIGFLVRFAEACGCRIMVHFPDRGDE